MSSSFTSMAFPSIRTAASDAEATLAFTQGHTAGYTAGLRKATTEAAARRAEMEAEHAATLRQCAARTDRAVAALKAAVRALDDVTLPLVTQAQDVLAHSSLELAEAVVGLELSHGDLSARSALARAMGEPIEPGVHTVRLNPRDLAMLDPETVANLGVQVIADPDLAVGDSTADFEDGFMDARISKALDRAKAELQAGLA